MSDNKMTLEDCVVEAFSSVKTAMFCLRNKDLEGMDACLSCAVNHAKHGMRLIHARQRAKRRRESK